MAMSMSMSSLKSTTRRSESGSSSCNPSKSDVPIQNGSHTMSRSKSDFSQKYLSDDSSTSEYRFFNQRSRCRDPSSGLRTQTDSESDIEGSFSSRRRRDLDFPPQIGTNDLFYRHYGLRRSSIHGNLSERTLERKVKVGALMDCNKPNLQHPNSPQAQENNAKPLLTKMQPLQRGPAEDGIILYDAVLSEIRKAVDMVWTELRQSIGSNHVKAGASESISCPGAKDSANTHALADIQKEFADKLEESQKRVRVLCSKLAVEERRCLEFAKIIQELLPDSTSSTLQKATQRQRGSMNKQRVSNSLHDEAQKYFAESISILDLEIPGDSSVSTHAIKHVEESSGSVKEFVANASEPRINQTSKKSGRDHHLVGTDGILFPWLQWESDLEVSDNQYAENCNNRNGSDKNSTNSSIGSNAATSLEDATELDDSLDSSVMVSSTRGPNRQVGGKKQCVLSTLKSLDCSNKPRKPLKDLTNFVNKETRIAATSGKGAKCGLLPRFKGDNIISEIFEFRNRIVSRELIICQKPCW